MTNRISMKNNGKDSPLKAIERSTRTPGGVITLLLIITGAVLLSLSIDEPLDDPLSLIGLAVWLLGVGLMIIRWSKAYQRTTSCILVVAFLLPDSQAQVLPDKNTADTFVPIYSPWLSPMEREQHISVSVGPWLAICTVAAVAAGLGIVGCRVKRFCDKNFATRTNTPEDELYLGTSGTGDWSVVGPMGPVSCVDCLPDLNLAGEPYDESKTGCVVLWVDTAVSDDGYIASSYAYDFIRTTIPRSEYLARKNMEGHPYNDPHTVTAALNGQPMPTELAPIQFINRIPHAIRGQYEGYSHYARIVVVAAPSVDAPKQDWVMVGVLVLPVGIRAEFELPNLEGGKAFYSVSVTNYVPYAMFDSFRPL